jgi:hypothetical protein
LHQKIVIGNISPIGFNKRKLEEQRREAAENEPARWLPHARRSCAALPPLLSYRLKLFAEMPRGRQDANVISASSVNLGR